MALTPTSLSPTTAAVGQQVTITGTGLDATANVLVSNVPATIIGTPAPTTVVFIVPPGAPISAGDVVRLLDNATGDVIVTGGLTVTAVTTSDLTAPLAPMPSTVWRLDVNAGAYGTPNWLELRGMTAFTPALAPTTVDASDFDSGLYGADAITALKWTITGTAKRGKGASSGTADPAQEIVRIASRNAASVSGLVDCRWYDRSGLPEAERAYATAQWTEAGGGFGTLRTVNFTLNIQGQPQDIPNPVLANPALRGGF